MPKGRGRRRGDYSPFESSDADDVNTSGANNRNVEDGVSRLADAEDGRKPSQRKGGVGQQSHKGDLVQWAQHVNETVQSVDAAKRKLNFLLERLSSHEHDLKTIEETKEKVARLEEEAEIKDEKIKKSGDAYEFISARLYEKIDMLKKEKESVDKEKEKLQKRHNTEVAEERQKLEQEYTRRGKQQQDDLQSKTRKLEEDITKQRKKLQEDIAQEKKENNRRVVFLETENVKLSKSEKELKDELKVKSQRLEKAVEAYDDLERAKKSVKGDLQKRERELENLKKEFALNSKSTEYFKEKFKNIYDMIEGISLKYFNDIEGKDSEDPEDISKKLAKADPYFASVPIDNSEESRKLCSAHAQRIITEALCEFVWKPFSSEVTVGNPDLYGLLSRISDEVEKQSRGRAANVWSALTMRALQSLPANPILSQASESRGSLPSSRAESLVQKVLRVLSYLVSSSQRMDLRTALFDLTNFAIEVWDDARTGELKVLVNRNLEPALYGEWRSQRFDPPLQPGNSGDTGEAKSDIVPKTSSHIFTLFPRVVARETLDLANDAVLPGSWPSEHDKAHRISETCIHPGVGLPKSSQLVEKGKKTCDDINQYISSEMGRLRNELRSGRRPGQGHDRRDSVASWTSLPSSPGQQPSQQWRASGAAENPE